MSLAHTVRTLARTDASERIATGHAACAAPKQRVLVTSCQPGTFEDFVFIQMTDEALVIGRWLSFSTQVSGLGSDGIASAAVVPAYALSSAAATAAFAAAQPCGGNFAAGTTFQCAFDAVRSGQ